MKVLGISKDSVASHQKFIKKHDLKNLTLLSDAEAKVIKAYAAKHSVLPVASRVYIVVDKGRKIVFRKNSGLGLMENQTETLLKAIDEFIP